MACALVRGGHEILSNVIATQTEIHRPFNGVFPELASRRHVDLLIPTLRAALEEARVNPTDIDLVAATQGPGLIGALLVGFNAAKALAYGWNRPFIAVNHVEAHLYAAMMPLSHPPFPSLGLVISGGHTFLSRLDGITSHSLLSTTRDDAVGEAFDKVASLLSLPYPGGPEIEILARQGNIRRFPFKAGSVKGDPLAFSFSGLKTNVLYTLRALPSPLSSQDKADLAASFQETALNDLVDKTLLAAQQQGCSTLFCGGGVSSNQHLRTLFSQKTPLQIHYPPPRLSLDNAAMIAGLGAIQFEEQGNGSPLDTTPFTRSPPKPARAGTRQI